MTSKSGPGRVYAPVLPYSLTELCLFTGNIRVAPMRTLSRRSSFRSPSTVVRPPVT